MLAPPHQGFDACGIALAKPQSLSVGVIAGGGMTMMRLDRPEILRRLGAQDDQRWPHWMTDELLDAFEAAMMVATSKRTKAGATAPDKETDDG